MKRTLVNDTTMPSLLATLYLVSLVLFWTPPTLAQNESAGLCFCDAGLGIGISQLVRAVNVALGRAACPDPTVTEGACLCDASGGIAIAQLVRAVNVALGRTDCPIPPTSPACENRENGSACDAGLDGVVLTCEAGICGTCAPASSPDPRFVENGDGTVTDRETCLVWEQKTGTESEIDVCPGGITCNDPHDVNNSYTWSATAEGPFEGSAKTLFLDVLNDIAGGGTSCFADHCDWRLPSSGGRPDLNSPSGQAAELESILTCTPPYDGQVSVNCTGNLPFGPLIDPIFGPTHNSDYWSSSEQDDAGLIWYATFSEGAIDGLDRSSDALVRAVRGGGPSASEPATVELP